MIDRVDSNNNVGIVMIELYVNVFMDIKIWEEGIIRTMMDRYSNVYSISVRDGNNEVDK